jgi:hypothetical protein
VTKAIVCRGDIADLLARYRQATDGTSSAKPKEANKWHGKMHGAYKKLRESSEGQAAIVRLVEDPSPHVRCWAAAHSLAWQPELAKAALTQLREARGPCSFDAEMTLKQFEKGLLTFGP